MATILRPRTGRGDLWSRWCLLVAVITALSFAHRYECLQHFAYGTTFHWHYNTAEGLNILHEYLRLHWREVFLGVRNDILFSLIAALALLPAGRIGAIVGIVLLAFFYAANLDHIRTNDAHIDLAFLGLAFDPTFVAGQTTPALLRKFAQFAGLGLILLALVQWPPLRGLARIGVPALALVLAVPVTANLQHPIWVQSHPIAPMLGAADAPLDSRTLAPGSLANDNPPLTGFAGQHNVLLVFVEGISQHTLAKAQMIHLQAMAAENIQFTQYFGHQMITANGLYASHTGLQPYVTGVAMRWYDIAPGAPESTIALPGILRDAGYQTAFLQAAPLAYMNKGATLPHLGYDTIKGDADFTNAHSRNGWGVDDLTLVEQTLAQIDSFRPDAPWLTTMLTTGTHSPYNVPKAFEPQVTNPRVRAARYADAAIAALMEGLEARGVLDNTVVIITSDEARETAPGTALEGEILRNWLPLIIRHPDGVQAMHDDAFAMIDLRNLILMLTGAYDADAVANLMDARDVFIFGNVRLDRMFYYDRPNEHFLACNTDAFVCAEYDGASDLRDLGAMAYRGTGRFAQLQAMVAAFEAGSKLCDGDPATCQ
ncbi:LTA synthase family protein [Yoonia sp. R2331]|uniref:LTA synthase family protein n=1 Tax=Yoonia sp. R2331 TaxID=3237238 RepID=UPI0034E5E1F6